MRCLRSILLTLLAGIPSLASAQNFQSGDRVVFLGDTFAEREGLFGHIEAALHSKQPGLKLTFRNLAYSADTPAVHLADLRGGDTDQNRGSNRALGFGTMNKHLAEAKADVLIVCFGMAASFDGPEKADAFRSDLEELLTIHGQNKYNGKSPPRIILVGPIAHEKLGGSFPDPATHNQSLKLYNDALARIARDRKLLFVDLFTGADPNARLTFNGIHLTDRGYQAIAPKIANQILQNPAAAPLSESVRQAIVLRNKNYFDKWRAVNGEYIFGRRAKPFGVVNFPGEMQKLDKICADLDARIQQLLASPDQKLDLPPLSDVGKVYQQSQGIIGGKEFDTAKDPADAVKLFKVQDGYEVNLFASEKDFPLNDPLAMAWDSKGRLWVSTMPSYPHALPGVAPNDQILILEDTDGDGKADKHTVFADGLYLPTGFEFFDGGVFVASQPNLLYLKDTDGDGKADVREVVLHGFGTGDSHHAMHAFVWGPDGGLYIHEGIFHRSNVETPHGVVRQHDAGIYRFDPRSHKLETYVSYNFANPWGHVFDRWGQNFIADASGGANYFALPITGKADFPRQHPSMKVFTSIVRPTCGCEIISSRHFPEAAQGNFLVNNNIGFQGIKQHQVIEENSGFTSKEIEPLLYSTDRNFRPVGITFGPDGALYIADWYNPLIGHMQFSLRDPNRDHYHGRIWRVTAKNRPLVQRPVIAGKSNAAVLDLLKQPENRTRYWARSELRDRPKDVLSAIPAWIGTIPEDDPQLEHHLLEALWVYQQQGTIDTNLLKRLLRAKDQHARAAATRALRHARDLIPDALELLADQVNDVDPRVRLEAVIALSYIPNAKAAEAALASLDHPTDYYLDYGIKETLTALEPYWKPALANGTLRLPSVKAADYLLGNIPTADLLKMPKSEPVYFALLSREGIVPGVRQESLEGLAKLHGSDVLTELFAAIERLDRAGHGNSENVLHDLGHILAARKDAELLKNRGRLEKLAITGMLSHTRQMALVALVTAQGNFDPAWTQAVQSVATLRDLVEAVPFIQDPKLRAASYAKVMSLLDGVPKELTDKIQSGQNAKGRFIRIEIPATRRVLSLAEVEVFSGNVNIARQGKAKQSNVDFGGDPARAIDGNVSGAFKDGSITHTKESNFPWWELDLGQEHFLDRIVIHNRSEEGGKYANRLDGFKLTVLDSHRKEVFSQEVPKAAATSQRFRLDGDPARLLKLAALGSIASIPGHEAEVFSRLSDFIHKGIERDAAVRAMRQMPRAKWPAKEVKPLADAIVALVRKTPDQERTDPGVIDLLQLGNLLAGALPEAEGRSIRAQLGELGVRVLYLRTLPHKMLYDRSKLYVQAGKPVVIVLDNTDIMPHNLVISTPGSLAEMGLAAEKLVNDPDAFAKGFVPASKKVLHATRMLQPRETERLSFVAPTVPGDYVCVCTFPGHWRLMNAVLHVVPDLSKIPEAERDPPPTADDDTPQRAFVRNWTYNDLATDMINAETGRDFNRGKELFKAATCIQCHKIQGAGGTLGPDLDEVPKKLLEGRLRKLDLLSELIEPSKEIAIAYQPWVIVTSSGQVVTGIIVDRKDKIWKVQNNPLEKPREVNVDDIEEKKESTTSLMPNGLLVTLTREEIFDLFAYVMSGGDARHPAFSRRKD